MTLDVLVHLLNVFLKIEINGEKKDEYCVEKDLDEIIKIISSVNYQSQAVDFFIHRLSILSSVQRDSGKAEAMLLANFSGEENKFPVLDFSDWPRVRYAFSGELQTPESEEYFHTVTSAITTLRTLLVNSEQERGVSPINILDKLLNLNSALPERYKKMANIRF